MKICQPYENWTRFPNCILDHLDQFTGNELKILALMVRKNFGWSSPNKQFSLSYICSKTNLAKKTAGKCVQSLMEKESIVQTGSAARGCRRFEINWEPPGEKLPQSNTPTGVKITPVLGEKLPQNRGKNYPQYKKPEKETRGKKPAAPLLDEEWEKEAEKVVNLLCRQKKQPKR